MEICAAVEKATSIMVFKVLLLETTSLTSAILQLRVFAISKTVSKHTRTYSRKEKSVMGALSIADI